MSTGTPGPRRPRHLIDPANPRAAARPDRMSVSQVQKWVMSVLATTTIFHLAVGIAIAAAYVDHSRPAARVGLLVIAAAFGMIALSVGFLIHGKLSPRVAPWLLLGWLPSLVAAYFMFWR